MKKEFGRVLRELRDRKKLTQQQVADMLGIAKGNISKYESGLQSPDLDRLFALAEMYGVRASELFAYAETGNVGDGPDVRGSVPLISWITAGHWREICASGNVGEFERVPTTYLARRYTYALRVQGDSMEPKFPDGCVLIIEPEEDALAGAFVIVCQNGDEATFKQLVQDGSRRYLKPLNPRYPIMELREDAVICGVVKRIEMDV